VSLKENIDGKVILISGAAGGVGKRCVEILSAENAKLGIIDLTDNVEKIAAGLRESGGEVLARVADICKEEDVREFVHDIFDKFGRIDGLLNIAALYRGLVNRNFEEIPLQEWEKVLKVNITGTWILTKQTAPYMKKQKSGSIVNISSATVFFGAPGLLHYVASKAAVIGMTRAMAQELGPHGIRVNCIAPGLLPTESSLERVTKEYLEKVKSTSALRKLAKPDDIIDAAKFLLSDSSASITGQTIIVDGGRLFL
jgi:NAD(P)-dependent dehydrogenase (short-subunit alcohol dehydrogenase family)